MQACSAPDLFVEVADDCDDEDAAVHPGSTEYCNAVDDDCDGTVDPDAKLWYADADGDGFGNVDLTFEACTPPPGFVAIAGDCDDGDPLVFPGGGPETCDGRDEDCDGLTDEGVDGDRIWYPDDDDDGFGDTVAGDNPCVVPPGSIPVGGDCDDANPDANPNRTETCLPVGVDDDCDFLVDDEDPSVTGQDPWFPDLDGDGAGAGAAQLSCAPIPGTVATDDDCDDSDPTAFPTATEVCGGGDEDCDALVDELDPDIDLASLAEGWLDADLDGLGDPLILFAACALGDGVAGNALDCDDSDPAIGIDLWLPDNDGDGAGAGNAVAGAACVGPAGHVNVAVPADCADDDASRYPGAPDPCGDAIDGDCTGIDPVCSPELVGFLGIESIGRGFVEGSIAGGGTGVVLAVHDFDVDGFADLAAGAPGEDVVRVLRGPGPENGGPWTVAHEIGGAAGGDGFGAALAGVAGDAGGTGLLLIGAPNHDLAGAAFVIADPLAATDPLLAPTIVYGVMPGDRTGQAVANLGDVDGSGTQWVAVGSPGYFTGAFTISTATGGAHDLLGAPALVTGMGDLGSALAGGRDLDGDGIFDLAAAAPLRTAAAVDAGVAYLFAAPSGIVSAALAAPFAVEGTAGLALGQAVTLTDLDGDGLVDMLVTASSADVSGQDGGAVYAFLAPGDGIVTTIDADLVLYGPAGVGAGAALGAGSIDGDPTPDLVIGEPDTSAGTVWLVPGAP